MIVQANRNEDLIKEVTPTAQRKRINNVHIIDASSSMMELKKYTNAIKAINDEINSLKRQDNGVDYTITVIEFSGQSDHSFNWNGGRNGWVTNTPCKINHHFYLTPLDNIGSSNLPIFGIGAGGWTPLYETVGTVLEKLMLDVNKNDATVVSILTDGDENTSRGKYKAIKEGYKLVAPPVFNELLDVVKNNYNMTITFTGTASDVDHIINTTNISVGNTMKYDNTGEGISKSYLARGMSLTSFSKDFLRDEVTTSSNFFDNSKDDKKK